MTSSKEQRGEVKPCPWCGGKAFDHGDGADYTSCANDIDVCNFSGMAIDIEDWNSAYCWKELSRASEALKLAPCKCSPPNDFVCERCEALHHIPDAGNMVSEPPVKREK